MSDCSGQMTVKGKLNGDAQRQIEVEVQAGEPRPQGRQVDLTVFHVQKQQITSILGLDIGGANLKAADRKGTARSMRFPLWRSPQLLTPTLRDLCLPWLPKVIAVVMTGELCDCFETRREGVAFIVDAVRTVFPESRVLFFGTDGQFHEPDVAKRKPWVIAAANFMALAQWSAQRFDVQSGMLIDIGSTTTDIIPLRNRHAVPSERTDTGRLASGELVYQGVERTPLCSLAHSINWQGRAHGLMNEFFATTLDVYLLTDDLESNPSDTSTADGRPANKQAAWGRMARMVGADCEILSLNDAIDLARQFADVQCSIIENALVAVMRHNENLLNPSSPRTVVLAGQGEFLARRVIKNISEWNGAEIVSMADVLGPGISQCACAYAVAQLAIRDKG